jgi:hypothetical protein
VRAFCLALALALTSSLWAGDAATLLSPTAGSARALSPAAADSDAFWGRTPAPALQPPALPGSQANDPGEDFAVVGAISLPFTALYAALLVAVAESIHQEHFPPSFSGGDTAAIGALALAGSITIAVVSVDWGGSPRPASPTAR